MAWRFARGGTLERLCLVLKDLAEKYRHADQRRAGDDVRGLLREGAGFLDLIRKVVARGSLPDFPALAAHLELLDEDGWLPQNLFSHAGDQASNKIFELLVALMVMRSGRNLQIDDPRRPVGDNPDVLADFGGVRWGFACKVMHGASPMTLFERLEEGVDQIQRSSAATGIVVFSWKNRLPHDQLFPRKAEVGGGEATFGVFEDPSDAVRSIGQQVDRSLEQMIQHVTREEVCAAFDGKTALPGCLVLAQTTIGVLTPIGPTATNLKLLIPRSFRGEFSSEAISVFEDMNLALHDR